MATNDVPVKNIIDEIENIGVNRKYIDVRNLLYKNDWSAFVATVPKESERVLYNSDLAKEAIVRPFRKNHRKTKQILRPSTSPRQNTQTRHQNHRSQHRGRQWNNHEAETHRWGNAHNTGTYRRDRPRDTSAYQHNLDADTRRWSNTHNTGAYRRDYTHENRTYRWGIPHNPDGYRGFYRHETSPHYDNHWYSRDRYPSPPSAPSTRPYHDNHWYSRERHSSSPSPSPSYRYRDSWADNYEYEREFPILPIARSEYHR